MYFVLRKLVENELQPFVVLEPSAQNYELIIAYHTLLRTNLARLNISQWKDEVAYAAFPKLYKILGSLMRPAFDPKVLSPLSRTEFFICTLENDQIGLSGLQKLLGYERVKGSGKRDLSPILLTSGRIEVDLLADLLVMFPQSDIDWLLQNYSLQQLLASMEQASKRLNADKYIAEEQRKRDLARWSNATTPKTQIEVPSPKMLELQDKINLHKSRYLTELVSSLNQIQPEQTNENPDPG